MEIPYFESYKVYDPTSGQFAGAGLRLGKRGKVWTGSGPLRVAHNVAFSYYKGKKNVPAEWVVIRIDSNGVVETFNAQEFFAGRKKGGKDDR